MVKKIDTTALSDHDLLLNMSGKMDTIIDDNADFKKRILKLEADKMEKSDVAEILRESNRVKEELYANVHDIQQGKTPYQIETRRLLDAHETDIKKHEKMSNWIVATCAIAVFLQGTVTVYLIGK